MNGQADYQQMQKLEEMKKQILGKVLDKEAFERLGRVRAVNQQLAGQVELYLLQLFQSGKLQGKVDDEKLKEILGILSEKKDFSIKRK
ncbi:MAG: DNA-binding protein [Candidatus Aenigmarchaeota archaeon]|nr:DNA-binding protein [Candidatus Aenigmarchaeota archaeon]